MIKGRAEIRKRRKQQFLELEQLAQAFRLRPAYRNLGLLLVVHLQHVAGLKPWHNFFDVVNVDEIRPVRPPEGFCVSYRPPDSCSNVVCLLHATNLGCGR